MQLPPFVAAHKPQVAVAAVAGAAGLYALHKRSTTAAAATTTAGTAGTTTTGTSVPVGGYSSDPYSAAQDAYNSLEPQLESLQTQISAVTPGAAATNPTPTTTTTAPAPKAAASSGYTSVVTPQAGALFAAAGDNEYVESNGQYVQVTKGEQRLPTWSAIPSGSSLYIKSG